MPAKAVPYETLVRLAVIQDRIAELAREFYKLDEQLGNWIGERLLAGLPDGYADHVLREFVAVTDARRESESV